MRYVIFGQGRVGNNILHYLRAMGHDAESVDIIEDPEELKQCRALVEQADCVIATIPDSSLQGWFDEWKPVLGDTPAIHHSGAMVIEGMTSFHPLYSFPNAVLDVEELKSIAFAVSGEGPSFTDIFPGLPNPLFVVKTEDRARYHALAVLSGNFASYLWNSTASGFSEFSDGDVADIMAPYLGSVLARFCESPYDSLTGPVARRDQKSAESNLRGLQSDEKLHDLYRAFLASAWPDFKSGAD
ncbi:MAG: DUF2520 domain-containing protein [Pseudomonadota bacterium]